MRFCLKASRCFSLLVAAGCIIFTSGCQSMKRPAYSEQGWASYIADSYEGRPTSSGAFYDPRAYTAAHNTLPFGTVVTVKNQQNGQKVDVVVNDRFPNYPGRARRAWPLAFRLSNSPLSKSLLRRLALPVGA